MSHFGVTAIRWNATHTEVDSCMVHAIRKEGDTFVLGDGAPTDFSAVADRIVGGDHVWVMLRTGADTYDKGSAVVVRNGQQENLFTEDDSLFDLPEF
ncbi:hypothetical protein [Ralstonia pseudosolanacearum]|uniref:hypothetical protein n=1 Tax=Ralstonia pseudosolanacearum TaxID=1310165 RepID=UPI0011C37B48